MNLITGYFTYTRLVNVIQQTVKGKVCRIFILSLVMLLYVATWASSMPVWAVPPVRKRAIPLPLPCPLPSPCKIPPKTSAKLRLLPVQKVSVCQFTKVTAWRYHWSWQSITPPLLTPAVAGSLSLVARMQCASPLWQWQFSCLSVPGEAKRAGMGRVWEMKGSCSKVGWTPTLETQVSAWDMLGTEGETTSPEVCLAPPRDTSFTMLFQHLPYSFHYGWVNFVLTLLRT